jgi:chemotaxis protein CheX
MSEGGYKQILVIDDEKEIAALVTEALATAPQRKVLNAGTPSEAYMRALTHRFDLVVTDFRMPKTDGVDLIKSIRSQKLNTNVPVLIISGFPQDVERKMLQMADYEILAKPFNIDDLSSAAERLLSLEKSRPIKKTQFDIEILNEYINSAYSTIRALTGEQSIKADKPFIAKKDEALKADITALINIQASKFSGTIALSFPEATYLKLVAGLTKVEQVTITDENSKTAGSIVSLINGQARAALAEKGRSLSEASPLIVTGKDHSLHTPEHSLTMVVPIRADIGEFSLLAIAN